MSGLSVCHCPECGMDFSMPSESVVDLTEVSCPICETDVPVQEVEAVDSDEDDEEELTPVTRKRR